MDVMAAKIESFTSVTLDYAYSFLKNVFFGLIIIVLIVKFMLETIKLDSSCYKFSYFWTPAAVA